MHVIILNVPVTPLALFVSLSVDAASLDIVQNKFHRVRNFDALGKLDLPARANPSAVAHIAVEREVAIALEKRDDISIAIARHK